MKLARPLPFNTQDIAMTNLTPEMESVMATLRSRLSKKPKASPLWNVVAAYLNATLISVEGGFRGERDLQEAVKVLAEYDRCRKPQKANPKRQKAGKPA
jgi:hypothetical protein